ncbi:Carboxylesterase family-domain-containing protein [Fusarium solani]|uniref:Carboxylic ester hydrolase n=1 Tax=Fusarium solani TaxID=169388 RepID=A0A9P9R8A0_FUSSL|nr:Carboxylesterase family-domain-containing protein [Fusarium solani]KAH7268780.1 Carboxylesterase family-domain-containing protein [Fusarium solani]
MAFYGLRLGLLSWLVACSVAVDPIVVDGEQRVTFQGSERNGIEVFLNIRYGEDTGGENRFKPPRRFFPEAGSTILTQEYGPACPQQLGAPNIPIALSNVTDISEDCLNLNIARPIGTCELDTLPVMVYIHGGSFWTGQNQEATIQPDSMVLESVYNGMPIIHVAMNYRLGVFGFAQSEVLMAEGSTNAGLRDQRLAIEWVRNKIIYFGGNPNNITIFGQSSGGLAVGMQTLAYGGTKPAPFNQCICQSQALEPGITGNFTINAMKAVVDQVGCNLADLHTNQTVECLRNLDMETLLNASLATYESDIAHNIGDIWLPVVDGDFLPAPPSQLLAEGRFSNVTTMIGWCEDDVTFFTDTAIKTPEDTRKFISSYVPDVSESNIDKLLLLYPSFEFLDNKEQGLSAEFYRSARIFRDILMVCQPAWYGERLASKRNEVFLYDWNQTILEPIIAEVKGKTGFGTIHTSEFAYIFGNMSHYNVSGYPFHPTLSDYSLRQRGTRSWSTFASTGKPGAPGRKTFQGFNVSYPIVPIPYEVDPDDEEYVILSTGGKGARRVLLPKFLEQQSKENETHVYEGLKSAWRKKVNDTNPVDKEMYVFVIGGPNEGLSDFGGDKAHLAVKSQWLRKRCAFINSPEMIAQLKY